MVLLNFPGACPVIYFYKTRCRIRLVACRLQVTWNANRVLNYLVVPITISDWDRNVLVGPLCPLKILSAHKEVNSPSSLAQTLHKFTTKVLIYTPHSFSNHRKPNMAAVTRSMFGRNGRPSITGKPKSSPPNKPKSKKAKASTGGSVRKTPTKRQSISKKKTEPKRRVSSISKARKSSVIKRKPSAAQSKHA
ncbi:hypothetical protein ACMFMG_002947 [Clarireedia jacksonii]